MSFVFRQFSSDFVARKRAVAAMFCDPVSSDSQDGVGVFDKAQEFRTYGG